jgi:uncharacterized protein DUF4190/FHA domain-containing protein
MESSRWLCGCGVKNSVAATRCCRCGLPRPGYQQAVAAPSMTQSQLVPSFAAAAYPGGQLIALSPHLAGQVYPLDPSRPLFLGRDAGGGVTPVEDPSVAPRHARIAWNSPFYVIEDLGSPYGTAVNGSRVTGCAVLSHGDVVHLGHAQFRFLGAGQQAGYPGYAASPAVYPPATASFSPPPGYLLPASRAAEPDGFAIASMVLGILGLVTFCVWAFSVPCSIAAVILGIVALNRRKDGQSMAVAGIVTGALPLVFYSLVMFACGAALMGSGTP